MTLSRRLDDLFAEQAAASPTAPAIYFRGGVVSYGDLKERADALARQLASYGVAPGVLVAVDLPRTPTLIAVVLAILGAGGAYLPIDRRYPHERRRFVLADSGAPVLVLDEARGVPADYEGAVLDLARGALVQRTHGPTARPNAPNDLAYAIYTSGSSGVPKGVMLGHGAAHLIDWARGAYTPEERSRIAATTPLCFDPSVFEIFVPLCTGGALILKDSALDPFTADERPTMLNSVPSVLAELCRGRSIPGSVEVLNVGGETLRASLVREVYRNYPRLTLYNHYGPTEATTCATVARVSRDRAGDPPIGRPVRAAQIALLDADGCAVADGESGEIHIGGPGLALGYLGRPDLTAARFWRSGSARLYRTGDLGCWRDGELHFVGRLDRQVKVRGFRVELGEIEAALMRVPGVEASVAAAQGPPGGPQLIGWVQSQQPLTEPAAREALAAWLPDYMVPARIVVLPALPRLVSGKVDHDALPPPQAESEASAVDTASAAEKPIIHVFEEVLSRTAVGPGESFFDIGGDSLSSVRAALRLEEVLGYEVPAALIHQAPSARSLAQVLEQGLFRPCGHLSLLGGGGRGAPLFCMADLFGHPFNYLSLARRLGSDRAIYGLAPGPLQARFTDRGDIAGLARAYLGELRRALPCGPYFIAGYSAGGLVAAAVAAALEADREVVGLILLDSYLYSRRPSVRAAARWAREQGARLSDLPTLAKRSRQALASAWALAGVLTRQRRRPPEWVPLSQAAYATSMIKSGLVYEPPAFHGPALVIRAKEVEPTDRLFDEDGLLGWSGVLTGQVTRVTVSGDHHQFLREPSVGEAATAVTRFLDAYAQPEQPSAMCLAG